MLSKFFTIPVLSQSVTSSLHMLFFILLEKMLKNVANREKFEIITKCEKYHKVRQLWQSET